MLSAATTQTASQDTAPLAPGTVLARRFRLDALLGVGGMGVVYRANDLELGIDIALKLLRPELQARPEAFERFRQEMLLARQVSSPYVVRIHDLVQDGPHRFITMDYVAGESLDQRLDRGPLPIDDALRIATQLAEGLHTAHGRQVVHRDLKPSNVLLDQDGNAHISDFGVALSLGASGLSRGGVVVGTPDYLSPEQARGGAVDGRSDLYALGLVLYEMLAGRLPFSAGTPAEMQAQRLRGQPTPVRRLRPDCPRWLDALVTELLQPLPAHRVADAATLLRAIRTRHAPPSLRRRLRRAVWPSVISGLVVLGLTLTWTSTRPPPVPPEPPPPDRIVLLPLPAQPEAMHHQLLAVAEHLRHALARSGQLSIVSGERTAQALAGLALPGGTPQLSALLEELPARRAIALRLQANGDGQRFALELLHHDGTLLRFSTEPHHGDVRGAALRLAALLQARLLPNAADHGQLPLALPNSDAALAALGEGLQRRWRGQLDAALGAFQRATELDPDYTLAWLALAEAAASIGDQRAAHAALERAKHWPAATLAPQFLRIGDSAVARGVLEQRLRRQPDDMQSQLTLAWILGDGGDLGGARALLQSRLARDPNDPRAWYLLGKFAVMQGDLRAAVDDYLMRALLLARRGENRYLEAEAINALGIGYARLGQTQQAEEQYRMALELRRALGHRLGVATTLRNLSKLARVRGAPDVAAEHLDEARALCAELGDEACLADVANQQGVLADNRGDYPAALLAYREALRQRERLGDRRGQAESFNNLGYANYALGDYANAEVYWRQARILFRRLDDRMGSASSQQNLGLLAMVRGQFDLARRRLQQSLRIAERQQLAEEAAVSRRNLAELALLQGRLKESLTEIEQARRLFIERQQERGLLDAALLEARVSLAVGDMAVAQQTLDGIQARLARASSEQRAIAALLRARIAKARRARDDFRAALPVARQEAAASGVRVLQLEAQLLAGASTPELGAEIRMLGHLPLWLTWAQQRLQAELTAGRAASAVDLYRQVRDVLDEMREYGEAWRLHRLGARALARHGDSAAADAASAAADAALARVREAAPSRLLPTLDALADAEESADAAR